VGWSAVKTSNKRVAVIPPRAATPAYIIEIAERQERWRAANWRTGGKVFFILKGTPVRRRENRYFRRGAHTSLYDNIERKNKMCTKNLFVVWAIRVQLFRATDQRGTWKCVSATKTVLERYRPQPWPTGSQRKTSVTNSIIIFIRIQYYRWFYAHLAQIQNSCAQVTVPSL